MGTIYTSRNTRSRYRGAHRRRKPLSVEAKNVLFLATIPLAGLIFGSAGVSWGFTA